MKQISVHKQYTHIALLLVCLISTTVKGAMVSFLYRNSFGNTVRPLFTKRWFSSLTGNYMDTRLSKIHIRPFIKKHTINMYEAARTQVRQYRSFNDFFTRELTADARPVCTEAKSVVSPADGSITVISTLGNTAPIVIKGKQFDLDAFLNNPDQAVKYRTGSMVIIYLAPHNYHRFHFPCQATPNSSQRIDGHYESVNPYVYTVGVQPLLENERRFVSLHHHTGIEVGFVSVGALCTGRIIETYTPHISHQKGEQMGMFAFGGSTVVLLFQPNTFIPEAGLDGTLVKVGQKIGTLATR